MSKEFKIIDEWKDTDYNYQIRRYKDCLDYEFFFKGLDESDDKYYSEVSSKPLANRLGHLWEIINKFEEKGKRK